MPSNFRCSFETFGKQQALVTPVMRVLSGDQTTCLILIAFGLALAPRDACTRCCIAGLYLEQAQRCCQTRQPLYMSARSGSQMSFEGSCKSSLELSESDVSSQSNGMLWYAGSLLPCQLLP